MSSVTSESVNSSQSSSNSTNLSTKRIFPTSAAVRYDKALRKSKAMNPLPDGVAQPAFTSEWPAENVALLERFRDWLVAGGSSDAVINQHRIPMAGHVLGLALKPYKQLDLKADLGQAIRYVEAKGKSEMWVRNCRHSLRWFKEFLQHELGLVTLIDKRCIGNEERFKVGLPDWLLTVLTRQLHLLQGNWRRSRQARMTYQFWCKYTILWRWLFEQKHFDLKTAADIKRRDIYDWIDAMLVLGYAHKSINCWLHYFQSTLRFMDQQRLPVNSRLFSIQGLKVQDPLPRFLSDGQVKAVKTGLEERLKTARTPIQRRNSRLDLALFMVLWQTGMRVSELEDLRLPELDLEGGKVTIRQSKGLKDRVVYLTESVIEALRTYLELRGPALTDHLFIYRHKPTSKDLVRLRIKAAGKRVSVYVTPHMLRHTFATQLLNSGCKVTTIQMLLGHKRLNTTMVYARIHDTTVVTDYFTAMDAIEKQLETRQSADEQAHKRLELLTALEQSDLDPAQRKLLKKLRHSFSS